MKSKYKPIDESKDKIPEKPKKWKTSNGKLTPQAKKYLSYKTRKRRMPEKLKKKGLMSSGFSKAEEEQKKFVRIIFRFQSRNTSTAHSPLYIQARIDCDERDMNKAQEILSNAVRDKYGSEVEEVGSYYYEQINFIQIDEPDIYYRRTENGNWTRQH
jgi:hypothetical protein